jgi:hypothetical protein
MDTATRDRNKDIRLLGKFVEVYCDGRHSGIEHVTVTLSDGLGSRMICPECRSFLEYAIVKRVNCPLVDEKPSCKHCRVHCYDKLHREKVKEIMAFAGLRLMLRGRLDYIWHYFF